MENMYIELRRRIMNNSFIKKAAAGLLSLALVFGTFAYAPQGTFTDNTTITASAEGEQSEIEVADETELAAALNNEDYDKVILTKDIELTQGIAVTREDNFKVLSLDMNGHTISSEKTDLTLFTFNHAGITLLNSVSFSGGSIIFQLISGSYIAVSGSKEAPVTLSGASTAAVMVTPGCDMNLTNAVVEDNAQGVMNMGRLTVTNSTIRDNNSTQSGAGIMNNGTLFLQDVEISNNTTTEVGGGLFVSPTGETKTEISGLIKIKDNSSTHNGEPEKDDVFLSGDKLTFGRKLTEGSVIGIKAPATEGKPITITDKFSIYYNDPSDYTKLFSVNSAADGYGMMLDSDDEVAIYKDSDYQAIDASISLTDSLDLNFDFRVPDSEREGGKIVLDGPNGKVEKSTSEIVEGERGIGVSYPIYANQMYLPVTAVFVDKEGVEHSFVNTTDKKTFNGYCVNDYLNNYYKNFNVEGNEDIVNMVKAVYTYGAYSANKFSDQDLPETGGIMLDVSDVTSSEVNAEISEPGLWDPSEVEGFEYRGVSLVLDSKTSMKFYFYSANKHEYTYTDGNEVYPLKAKLVSTSSSGDKLYYVEVPGISLSDLGNRYTIKADGNLIYEGSAMNFVRAAIAPTSKLPENTQNIAKALYKCYEYAEAM